METTSKNERLTRHEHATQMEDGCRERRTVPAETFRAPAGIATLSLDESLRHRAVLMEEYQRIMRMIVRPVGTSGCGRGNGRQA